MMKEKKLLTILLIIIMVFAFTACEEIESEIASIEEGVKSDPRYITFEEFNSLQNGMTYQQVVNIIGGEGTLTSETSYGFGTVSSYSWEGNRIGSSASVSFDNGKLNTKMQFGLN